jgi:cyclophilin family peptidyl-prolyl cis-trans isomerase
MSPFRSTPVSPAQRRWQSLSIESLEDRRVMAAPDILNLPSSLTVLAGAPIQLPLDGVDTDGDALSYSFSVDPQFQGKLGFEMRTGKTVEIVVQHTSSGDNDPSFTGKLVFKLFEDLAPRTTEHFLTLAERDPSFFENIIFHRVVDDFVVQGGDPTGTGTGGSNLGQFDDEFHPDLQHTSRGLLSMAKSSDDTNDSQFFVTLVPTRNLDFNHSIFGVLVEGESVLEQIANVEKVPNNPDQPESASNPKTRPKNPVTMTSVTVQEDTQNSAATIKLLDSSFTGTVNVNVTVSDGTNQVTKTIAVTGAPDTIDNQPFLQTIDPIQTTVNTPVSVTIPFTDVDGGSAPVFDNANSDNPNLELSMNATTGVLTVTPKNGLVGVQHVLLGVRNATSEFDIQDVPIYISPGAPAAPNLQDVSDTGPSNSDNITRRDNSSAAEALQFTINNVVAGAEVRLMIGSTLIGQATVPTGATSVNITTNGTFDLTDGTHTITAVQTLKNQEVDVGNLSTTIDLASVPSAVFTLSVDTTAPTITSTAPTQAQVGAQFTYNVESNEEGTTGFTYSLVESPAGATIDATTGVISWVPTAAQNGNQSFRVRATDGGGNTVEQNFSVTVGTATGQPPVIATIGNKTIDVDDLLTFVVTATDPDSPASSLRFSLGNNAPAGAAIDAVTGVFTWRPTAAQVGANTSITVRVTDGTLLDDETFQVTVVPRPITFTVTNGELVIPGTAAGDVVTLRGTGVAGQIQISGSAGDQTVDGVTGGIRIELGDGDDQVTIDNVYTAGAIIVDTGEGNDSVKMGADSASSSAKNFSIRLGGGSDSLQVQRLYVGGDLSIDGGAGNDMIVVAGVANNSQFWLGSSSVGATTLNGGDGDDTIQVSYSFIVGPWNVDGGSGNDAVSLVTSATNLAVAVAGGEGHDSLAIDTNYFVSTLTINGGNGSDRLILRNSIVQQSATIIGADGNDATEVANVIARGLMFNKGAGQDSVVLRTSLLDNLFADMGDGDDSIVMIGNRIFGRSDVDGGLGGGDSISDQSNAVLGMRKRRFEHTM